VNQTYGTGKTIAFDTQYITTGVHSKTALTGNSEGLGIRRRIQAIRMA
jgi:hypothetical protein